MEQEKIYDEIMERMYFEMTNFMDYESDEDEPAYVEGFIECYNRMANILESLRDK